MKFARAGVAAVAAVLVLSVAGQVSAAGIGIDGNGRQVQAGTTAYGIAIDPDGRAYGIAIDPDGRPVRGGVEAEPARQNWLARLLHSWFGWL